MSNDGTDLPAALKSAIEGPSGVSMNGMQVHRALSKPAELQAHAQGSEIHLGPGQEQHLPHEAWHVEQRQEGRVKPTPPMRGGTVDDCRALEREADVMGARAAAASPPDHAPDVQPRRAVGPKGAEE